MMLILINSSTMQLKRLLRSSRSALPMACWMRAAFSSVCSSVKGHVTNMLRLFRTLKLLRFPRHQTKAQMILPKTHQKRHWMKLPMIAPMIPPPIFLILRTLEATLQMTTMTFKLLTMTTPVPPKGPKSQPNQTLIRRALHLAVLVIHTVSPCQLSLICHSNSEYWLTDSSFTYILFCSPYMEERAL